MKVFYFVIFGFISLQSLVYAQDNTRPSMREEQNQEARKLLDTSPLEAQKIKSEFENRYEFVERQQGVELWLDKRSGIIFVDNLEYADELVEPENIRIFERETGQVKTISPTDRIYRRYSSRYEDFQNDKRKYDAIRIAEMEQQHRPTGEDARDKKFVKKIAKRLGIIGIILASLGIASEVAEGKTPWYEVPARLSDESPFGSTASDSGTIAFKIDDMLENLKKDVQKLDPAKKFSQERQRLNNELRTLYTDVQTDTGLQDEEKNQYLKTIAEIQDMAQPSLRSFPQRPPNRRNRSSRGLQGSLDKSSQEPQQISHLTTAPTRGLASVTKPTSLQCSCSCTQQEQ